jgi:membrane protein DedA with SNARE-associated domain/membrane-associated phospholipid phosphatase
LENLLHQALAWIGQHPGWAYALIFFVAMSESVAILGMIVPGVVLLLGAGALITTGAIAFWPAFAAASAGAVTGDGLSYAIGRHFDRHIRGIWPFTRFPDQLDQGVAFFERYGGWSVVLGRFFGPSRAVVPLVAGMMRMPAQRFYLANILSGVAQILVYLIPGMIFGASLKLAAEAAVRLAILASLLIVGLGLTLWLAHRLYRLISPHASRLLQGLLRWAAVHPAMGRVAYALADPSHPDARTLTALASALILASLLLGVLLGITLFGAPDLTINRAALDLGQSLHTPLGDRLMLGLTALGDPWTLLPMALVVYLYLLARRMHRHAHYWAAAAGFAVLASLVLGVLLRVPRPDLGLDLMPPWSFPSIPVLLATSIYGLLAVSLARGLAERWRWLPYAGAGLLVSAVAWSRVYFGVAWLSDVTASVLLGVVWVSVLGLAFRRHSRFDPRTAALAAVAAAALAAGIAVYWVVRAPDALARLTPTPTVVTIEADQWLSGGWRQLPERRADLGQRRTQALDIQLAGNPSLLRSALESEGWTTAAMLDWGNALRLLSPSLPLAELPVIPHVHDRRHESLALVRTGPDGTREVLRLWQTRYRLSNGEPIWVGNVTTQHKEVILDLIALPVTTTGADGLDGTLRSELERVASGLGPDAVLLLVPPTKAH